MGELIDYIGQILEWMLDAFEWSVLQLYEFFLVGVLATLNAIPVPDFLEGVSPFAELHPGIVFFLEPLELEQVFSILLVALLSRFIIRRIPVVG